MKETSSNWVVLKFGGTSVASLDRWQTIAAIIKDRIKKGFKPIVVCSAVTQISDKLELLLNEATRGNYEDTLKLIKERHLKLAAELEVSTTIIEPIFNDLSRLAMGVSLTGEATPRIRALMLAQGELLSTRLGALFLESQGLNSTWCDARELLIAKDDEDTNEQRSYLSASCEFDEDSELRNFFKGDLNSVFITQGFIARNSKKETVLLGRGGSDVSAAYIAAKIKATRLEIWTDVPGMYTANPRKIINSRLLKYLDYDEAQEIASAGAKVLHPRCIAPAKRHLIPLHIYSMDHPTLSGTVISSDSKTNSPQLKAISSRQGITLVSMETIDMWQQPGFLAKIFELFRRHGLSIDLVSTSESNVTVSLDKQTNIIEPKMLASLSKDLSQICQVNVIDSCAFVSLLGKNVRSIFHKLAPALEVFEEQKIYLVSKAANDLNLTFVVDEDQAQKLVEKLHDELLARQTDNEIFGETWQQLNEPPQKRSHALRTNWWIARKDELTELAKMNSPIYVYDEVTIDNTISRLQTMDSVDRIFYAIKANANSDVLKKIYDADLSFECVSINEVLHVFSLFPKIDPKRILFTPNFAGLKEYEEAFKYGVIVTLDNIYPLNAWQRAFKDREIFLRIDPGHGLGHHKYVHTGGAKSKFGISVGELGLARSLIDKCGARVKGLHAHVGSNIFEPDTWGKIALFLATQAQFFPDVEVLDVGGGLGVVEKPGGSNLDLIKVNQGLNNAKSVHPKYKLWIEPGRFLVAESGVLLAKVTQTKQKENYHYVGVDTGMNSLIRPALYGAYHEIINLSRIDEPASGLADVVGPICESGDVLGHERLFPNTQDGDIVLIATTGAYGKVMSSNYNLRKPAEEYFLKRR